MSEIGMGPSDTILERALADLGRHVSLPSSPDVVPLVAAQLRSGPQPKRSLLMPALHQRAFLYPVFAALIILAAVLAISPAARSAVASWFHIAGVQISSQERPPGPLGRSLSLGRRVSLKEAQRLVRFQILIPHRPDLGPPDEIYVGSPPGSGRVALVYRARKGLPRAATTGAGLLIMEAQARYFLGKSIPGTTMVYPVSIGSEQGVWLAGRPHVMYFISGAGHPQRDTIRLAGNVLLWQHGTVTVRIEGQVSDRHAIQIARSMVP
jgi:hypothetical protein